MNDCTTCKFDTGTVFRGGLGSNIWGSICLCDQGQVRLFYTQEEPHHRIPIQDCHAWKEKKKCQCYENHLLDDVDEHMKNILKITCKKCGRVIE